MSSGEAPLGRAGTGGHWVWPLLPGLLAAGTQPQGAEDLQALDENRLELDRQGSMVGPRPAADVLFSLLIIDQVLNTIHLKGIVLKGTCILLPSAWPTHCSGLSFKFFILAECI